MKKRLTNYFRAAFPAIAIQTSEEQRAAADAIAAAKDTNKGIVSWSATEGLVYKFPTPNKAIPNTVDLNDAVRARLENTVYLLRDIHTWPFDRDPILTRAFRELLQWVSSVGSCVVIVGPSYKPHPTVEKLVVVLDYSLPDKSDLTRIATNIAESAGKQFNGEKEEVLRALSGLSTSEAENALALSVIEAGRFDPAIIYREKIQGVKRTGLLEITDPDPRGLDAIGGLDALKGWIIKRRRAFTPEAEAYGLESPKGVLLVGVPGTGKSLAAKAIGTALGVPTLRLDIGSLFNSLIGESETRTRDALKLAEALSPCVLWCDEIDKGLAGSSGSGSNDSGVTKRVFGTIISWLQERRRPVFLVATANDVTALPPELLRKGRFDEIFAVDLPDDAERKAILSIHLARRSRTELAKEPLSVIVPATKGFTGSEIEAVIVEALYNGFDAGKEIKEGDLVSAANATTPLSVTAKEKIESIREWAKTRARFASTKTETESTGRRIAVSK